LGFNILDIEQKRTELRKAIHSAISPRQKLFLITSFFDFLFTHFEVFSYQSYLLEFLPLYLKYFSQYEIFGIHPKQTEKLLETAEVVLKRTLPELQYQSLVVLFGIVKEKLGELTASLNGSLSSWNESEKYCFPLLAGSDDEKETHEGIIETLTVNISHLSRAKSDVFILVPSEAEIEARIHEQIQISWMLALQIVKRYHKKLAPNHEVIISFDKKIGIYRGNSLGVVLTLVFVEELLKMYNAPIGMSICESVCFTGSVERNGTIPSLSTEIIKRKIEAVFYSDVKTFVLPKKDEAPAEEKLQELIKEYPNRNLKLIAVTDIEDLLNRRNVVDIKKLSILKRTGKTVVRNKVVSVLLVLFILLLSSFYFYVYDDNPYGYEATQFGFNIVNQRGKVLWTIKSPVSSLELMDARQFETRIKILDINGDKRNEILYCFNAKDAIADKNLADGVAFIDYKGKVFNRLAFTKTVYSKREILTPPYGWALQDTLTFKGRKSILACANNGRSYASAVFIIDLLTQKIISDTLWNCGQFLNIKAVDLDDDGEKEIVGTAINNGKEKSSFFYLELSKFGGQIPSTDEYRLFNIKEAEVTNLFLLPKTDFAGFNHLRWSGLNSTNLVVEQNTKTVSFGSIETPNAIKAGISYNWKFNTNEFIISIGGTEFRVERDSLVAQGKLQKPFTDTWEYRQIIHDQILEWNGKDFVLIKK